MTHTRQLDDREGTFTGWTPLPHPCPQTVPLSGLPCGHPVEFRVWSSLDGAYEDVQYRCDGGGHVWWIDGPDA